MKGARELYNLLNKLGKPGDHVFGAVVKSVENDGTCTVTASDVDYADVRLQSITENNSGTLITPTVNSVVLVQEIGEQDYAVIMYSQVDEVKTTIGTNVLTHNMQGFEMNGNGDSLGKILGDLVTQIQAITCNVTAVGAPTGIPINGAAIAAIKTRLDLFIK